MKKKSKIIFSLLGILLLVLLFYKFGWKEPLKHIKEFGWVFWLNIFIYFINHILLTLGWVILITAPIKLKHFPRLLAARIAGDSATSINPLAGMASEPIKALLIKDIVPFRTGIASVVMDRTIHTLGNLLIVIFGIIAAVFILDIQKVVLAIVLTFFSIVLILLIFIIKKQKEGFLDYIILKLPEKLRTKIYQKGRDDKIKKLDEEIAFIFKSRKNMNHFYISLFLHSVPSTIAGTLEIHLIMYFISPSISIQTSFLMYLFGLFVTSLTFFMPVGPTEGSYPLVLKLLKMEPSYGFSVGIIRRLRQFVWAGIGMLLMTAMGFKKDEIPQNTD